MDKNSANITHANKFAQQVHDLIEEAYSKGVPGPMVLSVLAYVTGLALRGCDESEIEGVCRRYVELFVQAVSQATGKMVVANFQWEVY